MVATKCNQVLLVLVIICNELLRDKADPHHDGEKLGRRFPISGVVGRAEVIDAPNPGGLGGTYAGSPIVVVPLRMRLLMRLKKKTYATVQMN